LQAKQWWQWWRLPKIKLQMYLALFFSLWIFLKPMLYVASTTQIGAYIPDIDQLNTQKFTIHLKWNNASHCLYIPNALII
jgi:hypothetical protein